MTVINSQLFIFPEAFNCQQENSPCWLPDGQAAPGKKKDPVSGSRSPGVNTHALQWGSERLAQPGR